VKRPRIVEVAPGVFVYEEPAPAPPAARRLIWGVVAAVALLILAGLLVAW
jgi:hypothetical protein